MKKVTPFLMFQGNAEEAINFYTNLIEDSEIISMTRHDANEGGEENTALEAVFTIKGQEVMCIDSNIKHPFNFTPSFSFFITCDTEDEVVRLYGALSKDGSVLMPLDAYPFSRKFSWVVDRFGVSWQLSLPNKQN